MPSAVTSLTTPRSSRKRPPKGDSIDPCPFCEADGEVNVVGGEYGLRPLYWVACSNPECGAMRGGVFTTPKAAIRFWNRRTNKKRRNAS